jgi:hypothetical protein
MKLKNFTLITDNIYLEAEPLLGDEIEQVLTIKSSGVVTLKSKVLADDSLEKLSDGRDLVVNVDRTDAKALIDKIHHSISTHFMFNFKDVTCVPKWFVSFEKEKGEKITFEGFRGSYNLIDDCDLDRMINDLVKIDDLFLFGTGFEEDEYF